jgi:hypothetical protein
MPCCRPHWPAGVARMGDWLAEPLVASGQLVRLCPDYRIVSSRGRCADACRVCQPRIPRKARLVLDAIRSAACCRFSSAEMQRAGSRLCAAASD